MQRKSSSGREPFTGRDERRDFLKLGAAALSSIALAGCPPQQPPTPPPPPPQGGAGGAGTGGSAGSGGLGGSGGSGGTGPLPDGVIRVVTVGGKRVFLRRRLSSWNERDYAAYRTAVRVMKSRPLLDPTSWEFQARIHGVPDAMTNPAWGKCPHGSIHFLSWHRMYVYFWERIVRAASGDPEFSIGYWRYESTVPSSLILPAEFRTGGAANPLFATRSTAINGGAPISASAVLSDAAMLEPTLLAPPSPGFGGAIESSPHNNVHVQIGGLMASVPTAAQDPIFWTHHANIDRFWRRWLDDAAHANPSSGAFLTQVFSFFDETGAPVTMTGADVLDTVAKLDYQYDDDLAPLPTPRAPGPMPPSKPKLLAQSPAPRFELEGNAKSYDVKLQPGAAQTMRAVGPATKQRVLLVIEDVSASAPPDVSYEVYLNLPANEVPDYKSQYFAGTFSAFGADSHHAGHGTPMKVTLNVTKTVASLAKGTIDPANVKVTFVPVRAGEKAGAPLVTRVITSFGKLSISSE
jgi:hypothetical protein